MLEEGSQKRQFLIILTIVFLGFIGISMPYLIFPPLFLNPDYSFLPPEWGASSRAWFLGITLAAYPLGQFIGSPILGALSDDYGRKKILSLSLLISALCNLLTGVAIAKQQLGLLIVSRLIAGFMEGNIAIARAVAADLKTLSKHRTFGKINAAASIAYLIGPLLGGVMADKSIIKNFTTSTPFFFICILFLILAALSTIVLKPSTTTASSQVRTPWQRMQLIRRLSALFSNRELRFLMLASTFFTLAVDIFYEFGPVYLTVKWALTPVELIFYNGALCLGLAVGNGWLPAFISSRLSNQLPTIGALGSFALLLMNIILTNSTLLMLLCFGASGLMIGLAVTLITVKISESAPDTTQGEVMGMQQSLRVLGDGIICLSGGALLILSPKLILVVAAAFALGSMLYYASKYKPIYCINS